MSNSPKIEIAASSGGLNQRFRKPKTNYALFVIAALLGVSLIVTVVILANRGADETEVTEDSEAKKEIPAKQQRPALSTLSFEKDLVAGELAEINIGNALSNSNPADCQVDWQFSDSNVPRAVLAKIKVDGELKVSVPIDPATKAGQWRLVGKVTSQKLSSQSFTIDLRISARNTAPVLSTPADAKYDPVLGASFKISVGDNESDPGKVKLKIIAEEPFKSDLRVEGNSESRILDFRPRQIRRTEFVILVEATDEQGLSTSSQIIWQPVAQSESAKLVERLLIDSAMEIDESQVKNETTRVKTLVKIKGESLNLTETIDEQNATQVAIGAPTPLPGQKLFQKGRLLASVDTNLGTEQSKLLGQLRSIMGDPLGTKPAVKPVSNESASQLFLASRELFKSKKLFQRQSFGELVRASVEDFEQKNDLVLKQKYSELDGLKDWLDKQQGFKAELFLALDPQVDNVPAALQIVNGLRIQYPKEILVFKNLAIAIAVSWDRPRANYHYANHQRRTKSIMPENLIGAVENFKHFVTYQNQMQGRAEWLPWEFLIHVVNHQTPEQERYWALDQYLARRVNFGSCYKEVPYDYEMLRTKSQTCKLNGLPYTLANLRSAGGVCAMQADFASRVGKSLGVPSEYVGGASANGENHAWVMWVEIKNVTKRSIAFSLESYGRYRGDNYYVGRLRDPKSGQMITDRQLELRLHTVGTDAYAKRQVDLLISTFPAIVAAEKLDLKEQLKYLEQAIKLCPWHEGAWNKVAETISGREIDQRMNRQMNTILNSMFVHFAAFPDFTLQIFDRLVSFVKKTEQKNQYYGKLIDLYVGAKRPDLACEARLKLTELLVEQENLKSAIQGLAVTVKAFPDEGRYVPKLLDRLEKLCGDDPQLGPALVQFYAEFLPLVPQKRGNSASKYCIKMYSRAIQLFTDRGATDLAGLYQSKLQSLQAIQNN